MGQYEFCFFLFVFIIDFFTVESRGSFFNIQGYDILFSFENVNKYIEKIFKSREGFYGVMLMENQNFIWLIRSMIASLKVKAA